MSEQHVLEEILEELRRQRIPDALWSTKEIGTYFGVTAKRATYITNQHTFPDPVHAPDIGRRWIPDEVRDWAKRHRQPKRRAA